MEKYKTNKYKINVKLKAQFSSVLVIFLTVCLCVPTNMCACVQFKRLSLHNVSQSQSQNQVQGPRPRAPKLTHCVLSIAAEEEFPRTSFVLPIHK